jgi:hypothetical protein
MIVHVPLSIDAGPVRQARLRPGRFYSHWRRRKYSGIVSNDSQPPLPARTFAWLPLCLAVEDKAAFDSVCPPVDPARCSKMRDYSHINKNLFSSNAFIYC